MPLLLWRWFIGRCQRLIRSGDVIDEFSGDQDPKDGCGIGDVNLSGFIRASGKPGPIHISPRDAPTTLDAQTQKRDMSSGWSGDRLDVFGGTTDTSPSVERGVRSEQPRPARQ